jgi:hypothetical protein
MLLTLSLVLAAINRTPLSLAAPFCAGPAVEARALNPLPLTSTFLYELDKKNIAVPTVTTKTGVKVNASVYIVDMENHSAAELKRYKGESAGACRCRRGLELRRADRSHSRTRTELTRQTPVRRLSATFPPGESAVH